MYFFLFEYDRSRDTLWHWAVPWKCAFSERNFIQIRQSREVKQSRSKLGSEHGSFSILLLSRFPVHWSARTWKRRGRVGFIWRQKRRFEKPMILSLSLSFSRINWRIEINPASHPTNRTPFFSPFSGEKEPRVKGIRPRRRISSFFLLGFIEGKEITRQFLSRIYSTNKKKNRKKRKEIITIPRHFDMERFSTVIHYNGMNGSEWW